MIAKALPDVEFHVFGDTILDEKSGIGDQLKKLKNVRMRGGFDGVERLPFSEFPVFLYTSQWDGTPTMIIAAALASIPIVASRVGGVGDIVTESRGYPVIEIENVAIYATRIKEVLDNPLQAEKKAERASEYVRTEHTDVTFAKTLAVAQGYLSSDANGNNVYFEVAK
jgi:glycosyltransferase involved in cell wall biosynthesis